LRQTTTTATEKCEPKWQVRRCVSM
jgi:hypothetical protein